MYRSLVELPGCAPFADDDSEGEVEEGRELPFDISLPAKHLVSNLLLQDHVVVCYVAVP